jgi:hypothetical protein
VKRELTLVAALLGVVTLIGAAVGFIRKRLARMNGGELPEIGFDGTSKPGSREHAAAVNGDRR